MTRLWWVSLATEMRLTTGVRWAAWLGGGRSTISLWMWRRRRRLLLISGECTLSMLLWPSTVRLWRERAAPSFWVCTSQRTSPGLTTLQHWPRKHSNVSTSSANSEEPEPRPPSCATFYRGTIESILTSCITVWYGACNASCRKSLQRIVRAAEKIVGVSLPSLRTSTAPVSPAKPSALQVIPPPDTQLLQSAAIREETAESPGQDQQTEGQLHPSGCQEAELPPVLAPPPLFYPTQHWLCTTTLPPQCPHPHIPPPLQTVTRTSHFVQHWNDLYLIQHCL